MMNENEPISNEEGLKSAEQRYYARVTPETADAEEPVFTEPRQRSKRTLVLFAIVLFPIHSLFFAVIISMALQSFSIDKENDSFYSITTWTISCFLALWIAVAIIKSNKGR